ncbi:MAG: IS66 family transposase [Spirochaetes bacterium]|nr:IS66 family transposase [Spirochaetota bacterium]
MADMATSESDRIDELSKLVQALAEENAALKRQLLLLNEKLFARERELFGASSEKLSPADELQYRLFNEAEVESDRAETEEPTTVVKEHARSNAGRKKRSTPDETVEVVHDLSDEEKACPCCGTARPLLKQERSEEFDLVPAKVVRIVHLKNVYGPCKCDEFGESDEKTIVTAKGPAKIVKGSDFTNRSIALCIAAKYADGIPFNRVEKIYERSGLDISRTTLSNLTVRTSLRISPLIEAMERDLKRSPVLLMDETPVQVHRILGKEPTSKSYMWVNYGYRDKRPIVRFVYKPTRAARIPNALLAGYKGYLQTDGYAGYSGIGQSPGIVHVGCFAHIRRKFFEAFESAGKTGEAGQMLELIKELYAVERRLRDRLDRGRLDDDSFTAMRAVEAAPALARIRAWLDARNGSVVPQSNLGKAISYALIEWPKASRYIDHALLRPDTNLVESQIRPFVVGRNGWIFMDSPSGATASAAFYSLLQTAQLNGHEAVKYLIYVFDQLADRALDANVDDLLPYLLKPSDY